MAEISSNHGHTFPSQYCAFKATQIVVVQKIASNPWRHVEKGKKDHRVRAMFNTQYVTSCGWMGYGTFCERHWTDSTTWWLTMHYTLFIVTPHWLIGIKICEI
jgi:hypothetical protein